MSSVDKGVWAKAASIDLCWIYERHHDAIQCKLMTTTPEHDARMAEMTFASVYPHYVTKVEKKGRTKQELHAVITWLTGFDNDEIQEAITRELTFETFFDLAKLNPKADQISGSICGNKIQDITTPLTKQIRYLDKLVDDLAKGKALEKVLRQ